MNFIQQQLLYQQFHRHLSRQMQRFDYFINKLDTSKNLKQQLQIPLPMIEQKKLSRCENDLKFISQSKKHSIIIYGQQPKQLQQKKAYKDHQIFMAKDLSSIFNNKKKNPIKTKIKEKLYETLEAQEIRNLNKKQGLNYNIQTEVMHKYIDPNQYANNFKIYIEKPSSRAKMYQPYRKISNSSTAKNQLRPIISQTKINNADNLFFSVEKMTLLQKDKSKSSCIDAIFQQKINNRFQKITHHSKLIKQINVIKQKGNLKKLFSLNDTEDSHHKIKSVSINTFPIQLEMALSNVEKNEKINHTNHEIMTQKRDQQSGKKIEDQQQQLSSTQIGTPKVKNKIKIHFNHKKYKKHFQIPFQTYYYRDLLWKVNYSNKLFVEVPLQYQHRLKVYVGKGNNSCMVAGLIARRPWYAFTDKFEDANFAWSQLKLLNYYKKQYSYPKESSQIFNDLPQKPYLQNSLLLETDKKSYQTYLMNYFTIQQRADEKFNARSKHFKYKKIIKIDEIQNTKMHNHLINNYVIGNKKALFNTMSNYYKHINQEVFQHLPLTFHIKNGLDDKSYFQFLKYYHKKNKEIAKRNQEKGSGKEYNAWIVKPGQNSNRGNGIKMCLKLQQIKQILKKRQLYNDGTYRTYIVQSYIQKPLLYYKRKFDLRHYIMMTSINGYIKGYWYKDGYVRTTSSQYNLNNNQCGIHLTNDAVQKFLPDYGKYQKGNKISYDQLHNYIQKYYKKKQTSFYDKIYPKMKKIATDAIKACSGGIDPQKFQNNFQIFGMDFMIDNNLNVWLIEINTNPCLELSCPLLASIIPKMVQNALELTLDAMFPPPVRYSPKGIHYYKQLEKQNKFHLVFDERIENLYDGSLSSLDNKLLQQQDDVFEDCGQEFDWNQS